MTTNPQKITFGEMRESRVRDALIAASAARKRGRNFRKRAWVLASAVVRAIRRFDHLA
jgi:hypothetical protein